MTAVAVVQARAGSTRLPGKVLADLAGRPLLGLLLDRLAPLADAGIRVIVATSDGPNDDPVAAVATDRGHAVVRGPEDDVLARYGLVLGDHPADHVLRITADCPLLDPAIVRAALDLHVVTGADYTSNTLLRTYPDGLDIEVMRATVLQTADREATDGPEREHVTPFVYRRPRRFHLAQLTDPGRQGEARWTVDTADDLQVLRDGMARLPDPVTADYAALRDVLPPAQPRDLVADPDPPVEHRRGRPYRRSWTLRTPAGVVGSAVVDVDDGRGTLRLDVDAPHRTAAHAAVTERLGADAQVTHLTVHPDPSGAPDARNP